MLKFLRAFYLLSGISLIAVNTQASSVTSFLGEEKVIISDNKPFLQAIDNADDFLYIGAYKLHDSILPNAEMLNAIKKVSQKSKIKNNIFIILESYLTTEEKKEVSASVKSGDSIAKYRELGIQLIPSSRLFRSTHCKILVTSGYAILGTTNFDKEFEEGDTITRDFSLVITQPRLIQEILDVIKQDISGKQSGLKSFDIKDIQQGETRLTCSPEQDRDHLRQMIKRASKSIQIEQQSIQDDELASLLIDAIERGVEVSILMSESPFGLKHGNKSEKWQKMIVNAKSKNGNSTGVVRLTGQVIKRGYLSGKRLHVHSKLMLVDGDIMYLGSTNFFEEDLGHVRNMGVITRDPSYIKPVSDQFIKDWQSHELESN